MSYVLDSLRHLAGLPVQRPAPERQSQEVKFIYERKAAERLTKETLEAIEAAHAGTAKRHKWRNRRWITLIVVNLLFVVSFQFDVQLVEGAMTASRVVGFHFADLNSALQVSLAFKHMVLNLVIGTVTVLILWWLLGGRTFCSWACPYHLIAEWAEWLHLKLAARKWVRDVRFHRGVRSVFYVDLRGAGPGHRLYGLRDHLPHRDQQPGPDLWPRDRPALGPGPAPVRGLRLAPGLVPLRLPHRPDLRPGGPDLAACGSSTTSSPATTRGSAARSAWSPMCSTSPSRAGPRTRMWMWRRTAPAAACAWTSAPPTP